MGLCLGHGGIPKSRAWHSEMLHRSRRVMSSCPLSSSVHCVKNLRDPQIVQNNTEMFTQNSLDITDCFCLKSIGSQMGLGAQRLASLMLTHTALPGDPLVGTDVPRRYV